MNKVTNCHVMAKPSGSVCNIDCEYCFYLEKDKLYPDRNTDWRMDDSTLEIYIKQYIEAQLGDDVNFAWQGGEPTLLGIDFYKKVVSLCERYKGNKRISHAFQTNGILIDEQWCQFFKENKFLIGVSIDGPENLHDCYRKTRGKRGTYNKVIKCIELLKKYNVEFNTLSVIHSENVEKPLEVYEFLKEIGSKYLQFIPLVERESTVSDMNNIYLASPDEKFAQVTKWSVKSEEYGTFLNTIFDQWVKKDVGKIFVQMFDSTLSAWCGFNPTVCIFSPTCGHTFALESNGDLYQCDHYVYPEYKLGNIHDSSILQMNSSKEAIDFGLQKLKTLNKKCLSCRYRGACHGGCPKHRFDIGPTGKPDHNYLCSGYEAFFKHTEHSMKIMTNFIKQGRSPAEIMRYYDTLA